MDNSRLRKGPLWTGTHAASKGTLKLLKCKDRRVLLILKEDGQQIVQVPVHAFGSDDMAALSAATEFSVQLAEDYACDKIAKEMMIEERNKRLQELGLEVPAPGGRGKNAEAANTPRDNDGVRPMKIAKHAMQIVPKQAQATEAQPLDLLQMPPPLSIFEQRLERDAARTADMFCMT